MGAPGHLRTRLNIEDNWKVTLPRTRIQFTERGFRWKTSRSWNELPESIRSEQSIAAFKKQLKSWIVDQRRRELD